MPKGANLIVDGKKTRYQSFEDIKGKKLHPKTFGIKLPVEAAEKLLELDTKQRTLLMRSAILDAIAELN
ncbi:MAG: hypothetical protein AB4372_23845 [Xenococcus sp. (in: cyanobacteria)]